MDGVAESAYWNFSEIKQYKSCKINIFTDFKVEELLWQDEWKVTKAQSTTFIVNYIF